MLTLFLLLALGDGPDVYGQKPKAETTQITITELMTSPETYLDQVVKVTGEVKEVCPMAGCWLDLADKDKAVRVKVKDGEIVFDKSLVGKQVVAEGTVYKFELTKEKAVDYYRHLAEEKGETFDPASVTGPTTIYQLGGIGVAVGKPAKQ